MRRDQLDPPASEGGDDEPHGRLNLLLSYGGWRSQSFAETLPSLLSPLGISCVRAESGEEAADLIQRLSVHIAVVDWAIPMRASCPGREEPGGSRILQLLRRLEPSPPTVVVRPPQAKARESVRSLNAALREGAFAVLDRPIDLEVLLETMRRILRRHYRGRWPA